MQVKVLGNSGIEVSVFGLGCAPLGGGGGWGQASIGQAEIIVHAALYFGINLFDTAESYNNGRSEELLGHALSGRRDQAIIATKISPQYCEPKEIRKHCEASLTRLSVDYIDLYQIHWPPTLGGSNEAYKVLESLREEGKIRAIGVSNFGVTQLQQANNHMEIASNQVCYNLVSRAIEFEILPYCFLNNIAIITYMPLMQGLLTKLYKSVNEFPLSRATTRHFSGSRPDTLHDECGVEAELFETLESINEISFELGLSVADLSLAWVVAKKELTSVLIGSRKPEQLEDNLKVLKLEIPSEAIERLNKATEMLKIILGNSADYWRSGDQARTR